VRRTTDRLWPSEYCGL